MNARLMRTGSIVIATGVAVFPVIAQAHTRPRPTPDNVWAAWYVDPLVVIPMLITSWLYLRGVRNLWSRAGHGVGITRGQMLAWLGAMLALAVAFFSPIDAMGGALFSVHMVQHLILFVIAPWLLACSRPGLGMFWGLPGDWRKRAGRVAGGNRVVRGLQHLGENPVVVVAVFTAMLWLWHTPTLYDAALRSDVVHALEHMSFMAGAYLLWSWLISLQRRGGDRLGLAVLIVFVTVMQSSVLGAILTFASTPLYQMHEGYTQIWGLSLMDDQQLAGLIMWVPMGMTFTLFALLLFRSWLDHSDRRALTRDEPRAVAPTEVQS